MSLQIQKKIGFIGTGNMAQAMISAWLESGTSTPDKIYGTNRTEGKIKRLADELGIVALRNNEELIDQCEIVVLAVKPQDLVPALESISSSFGVHHVVMSLAAGVPLARLKRLLPNVRQWVRVMPNTPVRVRQGVSGYFLPKESAALKPLMDELLKPLGAVVQVDDEDKFATLSVACSAGVGFVYELMQYWQEWLEEHDFPPDQARLMTVKTFLGTAIMADSAGAVPILDLQGKVTSKKGITSAGLNSMRELEIERLLRYSFEKAALRDREIGEEQRS
jgi:pyrroline-5-carboxylate reductase